VVDTDTSTGFGLQAPDWVKKSSRSNFREGEKCRPQDIIRWWFR
jgi:hypothetical protein